MITAAQTRLHHRACRMLGCDPNIITPVGPAEFRKRTSFGVSGYSGLAPRLDDIKRHGPFYYVRRGCGLGTYAHEVLHLLFPSRSHKWVFLAAWKLCGVSNGSRGYGYGQGYHVQAGEKIESKAQLQRLARAAAKRHGWEEKGEGK